MKARVKGTGEIIDVEPKPYIANDRWDVGLRLTDNNDNIYRENELDFEDLTQGKTDVKEKSFPKDEPDYWDKLHHQAAISAMSAFLIRGCQPEEIAQLSLELAGAMIEKLKNEK